MIKIGSVTIQIYDEVDCCGPIGESVNEMTIEFHDGGGGFYPVISTNRWALDDPESELPKLMHRIIKLLERHNR